MKKSILITPSDTLRDAKEFDKWDLENKDRKQKMPTLAKGPRVNRTGLKKDTFKP